nr:MAG TPA: hypothetical protein [Caudoviricetes sp.]
MALLVMIVGVIYAKYVTTRQPKFLACIRHFFALAQRPYSLMLL